MDTKTQIIAAQATHTGRRQTAEGVATSGAFAFLAGNALLGTIGVFVHYASTNPLTATWFRSVFGLLCLTLWLWQRRQMNHLRLNRETGPWILLAGALMVASWALFFDAITRTSAAVAIVLFHFQPMWVLLLGSLWLKEAVGRQRIVAVAAAMGGLVLATGLPEHIAVVGQDDGGQRPGYWVGVVACLIGAFCTACVTIIARKLRDVPPGVVAWWQCAIGSAALWIWPLTKGWPPTGTSWIWLAGLGLVHTGLAYTLIYAGMARLSTARVAVLQFVYPAVAILLDWLVFDRKLSGYQLAGVVVMAVAILLAERSPRK